MGFAMLDQPAQHLTSRAGTGTAGGAPEVSPGISIAGRGVSGKEASPEGTPAPGRALRLAGDEGRFREFTVTLRYAQLSPDQVCEGRRGARGVQHSVGTRC